MSISIHSVESDDSDDDDLEPGDGAMSRPVEGSESSSESGSEAGDEDSHDTEKKNLSLIVKLESNHLDKFPDRRQETL